MREAPERRCLGNQYLFASTHPQDHQRARTFCVECPALAWCRRETTDALASVYGLGVDGTWAGELYRDGRKVTTAKVANTCVGCGKRAKRKESHYCSPECSGEGQRNRRMRVA
jgi:hypothetical protein